MAPKEHLVNYFSAPEINESLVEAIMRDQIGFDPNVLPFDTKARIKDADDRTMLNIVATSTPPSIYDNRLFVSVRELRKPKTIPDVVEQSVLLSPKDSRIGMIYTYNYAGPRTDLPGLLQQLSLRLPPNTSHEIKGIDLTRHIVDQVSDLRFATVWLRPEAENGIRSLLRLPVNTSIGLTLVPGHILVSQAGSSSIIAELTENDLQKIGMNSRFNDNEDEMIAKMVSGTFAVTLELGKKLKYDYPRFMFGRVIHDPFEELVTSCNLVWEQFAEAVLN